MKGSEFLRKLKRLGRRRNVSLRIEPKRGKGSHAVVHFGTAKTTMQDEKREIPTGTFHAMLEQLGLTEGDLK